MHEIIAISIYAITDDLLKAIGHDDDIRREMSDAEIMTTALVAAMFFKQMMHVHTVYGLFQ